MVIYPDRNPHANREPTRISTTLLRHVSIILSEC
jgi:hypothetical protein